VSAIAAATATLTNPTAATTVKFFNISPDLIIQLTTQNYDQIQSAPSQ
jgi:hypothetical protein